MTLSTYAAFASQNPAPAHITFLRASIPNAGNNYDAAIAWQDITGNVTNLVVDLGTTPGYFTMVFNNNNYMQAAACTSNVNFFTSTTYIANPGSFDVLVTCTVPDTTPPTLQSAATNSAGTTVTLTFNESVEYSSADKTSYTVKVNGSSVTINSVAYVGSTAVLTLAQAINSGQTVTVSYDGAGELYDDAYNYADAFANQGVTNNSTVSSVAAPSATTDAASGMTESSATLNATVNDNGASTTVSFDYGLSTPDYGTNVAATTGGTIAAGSGATAAARALADLSCGTTYHYRVKAVNSAGTTYGSDQSFSTSDCNVPPTLVLSTLPDTVTTTNPVLNVAGTVTDLSGVASLTINGEAVTVNEDQSFSFAVRLQPGDNLITTTASDIPGLSTTDIRTIVYDPSAPLLTLNAPADNARVQGILVTVTGTVAAGSSVMVTHQERAESQSASLLDTEFSAVVNLDAGFNTIIVEVTDSNEMTSVAKRTIIADTSAPTLAIIDPDQDLTIESGTYLLKGAISDELMPMVVTVTADGKSFMPVVTVGLFEQEITFTSKGQNAVVVTASEDMGPAGPPAYGIAPPNPSVNVQRNMIYIDPPFAVTPMVVGNGSLSPDAVQYVYSGGTTTFTATADTGYHLVSISGCGEGTQIGNDYTTAAIIADCSVTATFAINTYTLNVNVTGTGNGSISSDLGAISCGSTCSDTYTHGDLVTLTAVADPGSTFTGWSGACTGIDPCSVTMDAAKSVFATFKLPCEGIGTISVPATSSTGSYQVIWSRSRTSGVTYILYEGDTPIYTGVNNYFNITGRSNGTYNYTVMASKNGYTDSPLSGTASIAVALACGEMATFTTPATSTTGKYQVRWSKSSTPGVTYTLYEDGVEIYSGANLYYNVSGKTMGTYAYTVQATRTDYLPSSLKGPVSTEVILNCANISAIYSSVSTSTTGSYQIRWSRSLTAGVTYLLYENGTLVYEGPNNYFNISGQGTGSYNYTVLARKDGYNDSALKGPVTVTVN